MSKENHNKDSSLRRSKRKAKDVEEDTFSNHESKRMKEETSEKEEEKDNKLVLYNKNLIVEEEEDKDEEDDGTCQKIERFEPGYSSNTLSSYNTFVCHLGNWKSPLTNYLCHPQFKNIFNFVKHEYDIGTWFPPKNLIFNAFQLTPFDKLKVVMIGMDPFISKNEAMGLSFSVTKNVICPPTTQNMFKALENDTKLDFKPPIPLHGDLQTWAKQGVLMLNNWLTVREGASYSHSRAGWNKFTKAVLEAINKEKDGVIFLCWGSQAMKIWKRIDKKALRLNLWKSVSFNSKFPKIWRL